MMHAYCLRCSLRNTHARKLQVKLFEVIECSMQDNNESILKQITQNSEKSWTDGLNDLHRPANNYNGDVDG